jgi:hypothetical protein
MLSPLHGVAPRGAMVGGGSDPDDGWPAGSHPAVARNRRRRRLPHHHLCARLWLHPQRAWDCSARRPTSSPRGPLCRPSARRSVRDDTTNPTHPTSCDFCRQKRVSRQNAPRDRTHPATRRRPGVDETDCARVGQQNELADLADSALSAASPKPALFLSPKPTRGRGPTRGDRAANHLPGSSSAGSRGASRSFLRGRRPSR